MKLLYPFRKPIRVSQEFGNDLILDQPYTFNGVTYPAGSHFYKVAFDMDGHNGIDYACPIGTDVLASHDGIVTALYNQGGYGNYIKLEFEEDGLTWQVIYGHLNSVLKTGPVKKGDHIAESGNSSTSTNPHCHFGLGQLQNGQVLNLNNGFKGSINAQPYLEDNMKLIKDNGTIYLVAGNNNKVKLGIADPDTQGLFGDEPVTDGSTAGITETYTISKGFIINKK